MKRSSSRYLKTLAGLVLVAATAGLSACGASSQADSGGSETLNTVFYANMQVPDPDVFYESEGLQVTMAAYDGLLQYSPAGKIIPDAASSWSVSANGLEYSFQLRSNLKFANGKTATSADVLYSFRRRTAIGKGPAYMLDDVASYATPSPAKFIIHLKAKNLDFLGYLASPYSPKVLDAAVVKAHTLSAKDDGQAWLSSHSAGTGAFQISQFVPGNQYTLTRNDYYWGGRPRLKQINISIIPDQTTAVLELERGQFDVLHNLTPQTLAQFANRKGFQRIFVPAVNVEDVHINPLKPPFNSQAVRVAFREAINLQKIVPQVWGVQGSPATQMVPPGELPSGLGKQVWTYNPAPLKALAAKLPAADKKVVITYQVGLQGDQNMSQALQAVLTSAGFNVTVQAIPISELFGYRTAPESKVPNIAIELENPDTATPTNFAQIYYGSDAFLNFLHGGSKTVDQTLLRAQQAPSVAKYQQLAGQALDMLYKQADFILVANVKGAFVATSCLHGYVTNPVAPNQLNFDHATISC